MGELIPIAGIIMGCMIPITALWTKHQQKLAEMQIETTASASAEKAAQYASQIQRLEDRVQVLERIVTDKGYDVATQIEALRDARSHDKAASGTPLGFESREKA
ncbi:hypothetical protein [Alteriqipengyuania lutimaris]|uniref:Uncharacterized protein n=1 Tax=Alteriqipengyuania lutimaris TaxID=1538146 RepID=A0A395LN56_9SPHN|nr:hypothetical protein [Alteriqipengyuania lutimaris]MBB3032706.1 hypothetical protein [Alteriqipengyuania lutimaris]RDS78185.1 hypothetical protein DL238_11605 [Alteriqipengyuania lutimaris]